jgi:iron complex outermembrane recepter protein
MRSSILAGFAAALMGTAPVLAQDPAEQIIEEDEEEAAPRPSSERIVVTGSLIRRDEFTSTAPIQVITAEIASLEGLVDTAAILQGSTIAAGSTQINTQFGGFIVGGGPGVNTVSLRGLGAQRTLLLFNGRRFGPAGVEGRVGSVDLNTIPASAIQRVEILKDGASSIYGSDAVAGVVNVITRTEIDRPELSINANVPLGGGGESISVDGAYGFNFDRGSITISAAYEDRFALRSGDRSYYSCNEDYVFNSAGERIDIQEANPLREPGNKCFNIGVVNAIDAFTISPANALVQRRFIIDPAATAGDRSGNTFPGFRLIGTDGTAPGGAANRLPVSETDTNDPRLQLQDILPEVRRYSVYSTANFDLNFAEFYGEALYSRRETRQTRFRQFFPQSLNPELYGNLPGDSNAHLIGVRLDPQFDPVFGGVPAIVRPIALIPFNTQVEIDYFYGAAGLRGQFGPTMGLFSDWNWDVHVSHSRSDGSYTRDTVDARNVIDAADSRSDIRHDLDPVTGQVVCTRISSGASCPAINYFTQSFMDGNLTPEERAFLLTTDTGNTVFTQTLVNGVLAGELFSLPAGNVGVAVGAEYRRQEIDDQPGPLSFGGNQWGLTSAVNTQGTDNLYELFGEIEVPLLAGLPFMESLTVNGSGRWFNYSEYDADYVYKAGVNWQINSALRLRSTYGTSFRAPGLFELFLGDQSGFAGQLAIDPCINWGQSQNPEIRANCAADGIPEDYTGAGTSSATVISGGGAGILEPETSDSFTIGAIFTPTRLNLSVAVDYFEITVDNQVAQLGAGAILGGCYSGAVFPNEFCNLFTRVRNPNSPQNFAVDTVNNNFININQQSTRGIDLTVRYEHELNIGRVTMDASGTWTLEDKINQFEGVDGFATNDFNGAVGNPYFVGRLNTQLRRGDFTYSWFIDFVGRQSNEKLFTSDPTGFAYFGDTDTFAKRFLESTVYHGASVRYQTSDVTVIGGFQNIFDERPPAISFNGGSTRLGNTAINATQYDLFGRTAFVRLSRSF